MYRLIDSGLSTIAIALLVLFALAVTYPWWAVGIACAIGLMAWCWCVVKRNRLLRLDLSCMSPDEYEGHCAEVLRAAGWSVRVIGGTGDQGIDVIAELRGTRAAIQCKKYTRSAGNSAVQQIVAGKRHHAAQIAVVACPAGYTSAAKELADSNAVLLLSHEDLPHLERLARVP